MMNLLGSIAVFERDIMIERQREGIAKAKEDGKNNGRAPTALRQSDQVRQIKGEGKTADQIVEILGISRSSVFRILRQD